MLVEELNSYGFGTARGFTYLHQSDAIGLPGIHIECKFVEALNVRAALKQAVDEAEKRKDGMPTVFWKKSYKDWVVAMRLEDWITLYKGEKPWEIDSENS